jgi:cytochrome c553
LFLAAGACIGATLALAQNNAVSPAELSATIANCETCHGPHGNSATPATPRLNGQQAGYIAAQLKNFRNPTMEDPHTINAMWRTATHTGDEMVSALANYFASKPPTPPLSRNSALAAEGQRLYAQGAVAQNLPACMTCHGPHGEGGAAIPRLAGQHAAYLTHAMEVLQMALRESDVMHPKMNNITDDQIKALVAYLANE